MNLLLLTGGNHPYHQSTPVLKKFIEEAGHTVTLREDSKALTDGTLVNQDAIIFNTLRTEDATLTRIEQNSLIEFIKKGKGFIPIHISGSIPEKWPEYATITGGGWVSGVSFHPPYGTFQVDITDSNHPCSEGLQSFQTNDELYMGIDYGNDIDVFITSSFEGGNFETNRVGMEKRYMPKGTFPLAWTKNYGRGRVFVTLLGHDGKSHSSHQFQRMILNGIDWITGG